MKEFENAIDISIAKITEQLSALQQIKLLLNSKALKELNNFPSPLLSVTKSNNVATSYNPQLYIDYPHNKRFIDKIEFLDKVHPKGWRLPERRDLIIQIEGEEAAQKTLKDVTAKLQYLRKTGSWILGKYGNVNKFSFYFKPEWLNEDKKGIRPEFAPPIEILQNLSEEKRQERNIVWLT